MNKIMKNIFIVVLIVSVFINNTDAAQQPSKPFSSLNGGAKPFIPSSGAPAAVSSAVAQFGSAPIKAVPAAANQQSTVKEPPLERIFQAILDFRLADACRIIATDPTAMTKVTIPPNRYPGQNIIHLLLSRCKDQIQGEGREDEAVKFLNFLNEQNHQGLLNLMNALNSGNVAPLNIAVLRGHFKLAEAMIFVGVDVTTSASGLDKHYGRNIFMLMLDLYPDVNGKHKVLWDRIISAVYFKHRNDFDKIWSQAVQYEKVKFQRNLLEEKNIIAFTQNVFEQNFSIPSLPSIIGPSCPANSGNNQIAAQEVSTAYSLAPAVRLPQGVFGLYSPIIGNSPQLPSVNQVLGNRSLPTKAVAAAVNQQSTANASPMERIFHAILDFRLEEACRIITIDPTAMTKVTVPPNRFPGQNIIHLLLCRCNDQIQGEGREDEAVKFLNFLNEQNHQGLLNLMNALNSENVAPLLIAVLRGHFKLAEAMIFAGVDVTTRAGGLGRRFDRNIFMLMLDLYPDVNGEHRAIWDRIVSAVYFKHRNDFDKIWSQAVQYEKVKFQRNLLEEKNVSAFTQNVSKQIDNDDDDDVIVWSGFDEMKRVGTGESECSAQGPIYDNNDDEG